MIEFCVGLALLVSTVFLSKRKFEVTGLFGIAMMAAVCYGLGYLVVDVLYHGVLGGVL